MQRAVAILLTSHADEETANKLIIISIYSGVQVYVKSIRSIIYNLECLCLTPHKTVAVASFLIDLVIYTMTIHLRKQSITKIKTDDLSTVNRIICGIKSSRESNTCTEGEIYP